jgi:hypothetical protein
MKYWFIAYLLLMTFYASAQPDQCGCRVVLNEAATKVEQIYAGFKDKVNSKTKTAYIERKASYAKFASSIYNMLECHQLVVDFLDFYRDNHIFLQYNTPASIGNRQTLKISDQEIKRLIASDKMDIAGIWQSADKKYRYAILPYKSIVKGYTMITLSHPDSAWKAGTVKAVFTDIKNDRTAGYLFRNDFSLLYTLFSLENRVLDMGDYKLYREMTAEHKEVQAHENIAQNSSVALLNDSTWYVRIPTFMQKDVKMLDRLLQLKRSEIANSKQVIIDIRGNGGGDASPPMLLLQILGTDTLESPSWDYRVSKLYIAKIESRLKGKTDSSWYKKFKSAKGSYIHEKSSVIRLDPISKNKQKIAVLINEGCAIASEMFIYYARQSENVTLFGTHSSGTMDYGPTDNFPLTCKNFSYFSIPYGRNGWVDTNPIDKIGFQPDVEIAPDVNWIGFVTSFWSNQK